MYCRLEQDGIDVDVLGSSHPFKDIKRRYVFRILYGAYDAATATLQEKLRQIEAELRVLTQGTRAFEQFLQGTPLDNRARLEQQLTAAQQRAEDLMEERRVLSAAARESSQADNVRLPLAKLDEKVDQLIRENEAELRSISQLRQFSNQLQTESARLTRAVVAGERLADFDFIVCPRCGSAVDSSRGGDGQCYVCLQEPSKAETREGFIREQSRVEAQITETEELITSHVSRASAIQDELGPLREERGRLSRQLDDLLSGFVSERAAEIEGIARAQAEVEAEKRRMEDYLSVLMKFEQTSSRISRLEQEREDTEASLEQAAQLDAVTAFRIEKLETIFHELVDSLEIPVFGQGVRAAIDRTNYEPIVNGRKFPELSAGVRVLVNVAHILAHHLATLELELPLPGILMVDGINKNIGTAEYDAARIEDVWSKLIELHQAVPEDLQVIVAANDVPPPAREFVRLTLSADDRLVPVSDLAASP